MSYHPYVLNPERYSPAAVANFTPEEWHTIFRDLLRAGRRREAEMVLAAHEREIQIAKDAIARADALADARAAERERKLYKPRQEAERLRGSIAGDESLIKTFEATGSVPSIGAGFAPDPPAAVVVAEARRRLTESKAALAKVEAEMVAIEAEP